MTFEAYCTCGYVNRAFAFKAAGDLVCPDCGKRLELVERQPPEVRYRGSDGERARKPRREGER